MLKQNIVPNNVHHEGTMLKINFSTKKIDKVQRLWEIVE